MGKVFYVSSLTHSQDRLNIVAYIKEEHLYCKEDTVLETVIGEILQNVLRHAYTEKAGEIFVCVINNNFLLIKDFGKGFNIKVLEEKDFNSDGGGLGIPLVKIMLNKENVHYFSKKNVGTSVLLKFPELKQ